MRTGQRSFALAAGLALLALAGCKSSGTDPKQADQPKVKPPRASIVLRVKAAPDLNPNDRDEPTPVDLKVYQLKDRPTFSEASFEDLWTKEKAALGESAVGDLTTLSFEPRTGETAPSAHEIKLDPRTKFLGLMGLFSAERKEGLEERKIVVSLEECALKIVWLTKHKIELRDPEPQK